jgi:RHS repeat-associated protein
LTSNGITSTFTYDALDRRTSKTINGQTEIYLYDGDDIISESGAVNSVYTHGSGVDEPLIRKGSTQSEYYLADHLGSVIGLTDISGNLKTSYNYSAYGKKQTTGATSSNPFAFTGREDDGNGYYYYRARYYNPDLKRFLSEDPAGFGGGDTNLYGYVGGSPSNFVDSSGRGATIPWGPGLGSGLGDLGPGLGKLVPGLGRLLGPFGGILGDLLFPESTARDEDLLPKKNCPLKSENANAPDDGGVSDLLAKATPKRNDKSKQHDMLGDVNDANKDFDTLRGTDEKSYPDGVRSKVLPDGSTVSVRPESSEGEIPTIQINPPNGRAIKIRYRK